MKQIHIPPSRRAPLIYKIPKFIHNQQWIGNVITSPIDSQLFTLSGFEYSAPMIIFGSPDSFLYDSQLNMKILKTVGLYQIADRFQDQKPINVGTIYTKYSELIQKILKNLQTVLESFNFQVHYVKSPPVNYANRGEIEQAFLQLQKNAQDENKQLDLVFGFLWL
jgi:hypothetical protein